ncbi:MAG: DUF4469 domain-containing protein [Treponema sp.]|nr:DUF4469 domain-containing protein [Treponema sp.]
MVEVEGIADAQGYIDEFMDVSTESMNETTASGGQFGGQFGGSGHKLKMTGDDPEVGVYFVPADNGVAVKVAGHLAENTASKLIGVIPTLSAGKVMLKGLVLGEGSFRQGVMKQE